MTDEETAQFYKAREAYLRKCEDFKEEMFKYLSTYENRRHSAPEAHRRRA